MISFRKKIFSLLLICAFCFSGCTNSSEYYVQGLVNLSSQESNKAIKNFEKAIKKGSSIEVLLSLKELEKLNIPKTKMLKLTKLATAQNKYPEIETYNFYLQSLIDNQKYEQVIKFSNSLLNLKIKNDWMMYCFSFATVAQESSLENSLVVNWLTQESFSRYHAKFFEEIFIGEFANKIILQNELKLLLEFRYLVYEKNYNLALEKLSLLVGEFKNIIDFSPQVISDIGKVFLYGSSSKIKLCFSFESIADVAQSVKILSTQKNNLTKGNTKILVYKPTCDLGLWYENLKSAQAQLQELNSKEELTELEESNALMKLRETLLDSEGSVTHPGMISFYPNHVSWLWTMMLTWILWIGAFIFGFMAYDYY